MDVGQDQVGLEVGEMAGLTLDQQDLPRPLLVLQVAGGGAHRQLVILHRHHPLRPQSQGRQGQDAGAGAQVQHPPGRLGFENPAQQGQAAPGGGMVAGAEGQTRLQADDRLPRARGRFLPHRTEVKSGQ